MIRRFLRTLVLLPLLLALAVPAAAAGFALVGTWAFTWDGLFHGVANEALGGGNLAAPTGPESILATPATLPGDRDGVEAGYGRFSYVADFILSNYAVAADVGPVRLQAAWSEMILDDVLVRTAYEPEGTGETFDVVDRIQTLGATWRLLGGAAGHRGRLGIGAAWRHYYNRLAETSSDAETLEVGLIGDVSGTVGEGRLTMGAALAVHNLLGAGVVFDERKADLPQHLRGGLALTYDSAPWGGLPGGLRAQAVLTRREDLLGDYLDADLMGLELGLGGVLALRLGRDSYQFGGSNRYGVGLALYDPQRRPLGLWLDWTHVDLGALDEDKDMFSLRARWEL